MQTLLRPALDTSITFRTASAFLMTPLWANSGLAPLQDIRTSGFYPFLPGGRGIYRVQAPGKPKIGTFKLLIQGHSQQQIRKRSIDS